MLVLLVRLIALYGSVRVASDSLGGALTLSASAFAFAFLRESLRGAGGRPGKYVGIDEAGPSRLALFSFAAFESCFYVLIHVFLMTFVPVFLVLWMLPLGMIWLESSLFYFRTRLHFTDAGVEASRFSHDQLFAWSELRVTHGAAHVTLIAGDQRARLRLGATQTERFIEELMRRDAALLANRGSSQESAGK